MIWRMRNYARFHDKIEVFRVISVNKDLTCLVRNSSKYSMKNDMLDFNVIKFFCINIRSGKVLHHLPVRWEFSSPDWVKINTKGVDRGILVLLLVVVFFVGIWGSLLVLFLCFLKFRPLWLLSFMKLYMLCRKLKRWSLLMSGLNVILHWFVLRLRLGLIFRRWFIIDEILVLITIGKLGLGLFIFFMKKMHVLINWLI